MEVRQIRTSIETRGLLEKLRDIYCKERFKDEQVMMTPGYLLNSAYEESKLVGDWNKIIDHSVTAEEEFTSKIKDSKTQIVRFKLSDTASEGLDNLTKKFSDELGLRVQTGFTAKQIIKAAILLRDKGGKVNVHK